MKNTSSKYSGICVFPQRPLISFAAPVIIAVEQPLLAQPFYFFYKIAFITEHVIAALVANYILELVSVI